MKQVLKAAGGLLILAHIAIGILIVTITGCGEVEEEATTTEFTGDTATAIGTIGEMKVLPDAAPGAPSAPVDGSPYVKSVRYYSDWQLTEEVNSEEPVPVGTLIYIHIVFSEPVKHRITDNPKKDGALPVLFYWVNGGITRFRIMQHGASGEDFTSGDAKPKGGGTDDFICKYRVRKKDQGSQFWIRIGRWSVDLEWNKMPNHYVHETRLRLGEPEPEEKEEPEQPAEESEPTVTDDTEKEPEPTQPADTIPPTVVSITHYNDRTGEVITEGESVEHNTTVKTEIVLSEPIDPTSVVVTYTTGGKTARYSYAAGRGGVHWRGTFRVSGDNKTIRCKQYARKDGLIVTLEAMEDMSGNALAEPVATEVPVGSDAIQPTVPDQPTPDPTVPQPLIDTPAPTIPSQPAPEPAIPQTYSFEDGVYILGGETYPGYNPSPGLQRILDTHPSANLPHFLEAVQMEEVIDWVYRRVWKVYPNRATEGKKRGAARESILNHFGTSRDIGRLLAAIYFPTDELPPGHSKYWMDVEYLRLKIGNPSADAHRLLDLFVQSADQQLIVGIVNPND